MEGPADVRGARREAGALWAAALTRGPAELLDFLVPLWAGAALGAEAVEVGLLVGLELAVSVVARPLAGALADVRERRTVAAGGALLYGLSAAGYGLAGSLPLAFGAAAVGGVGGALLWVSLRAMAGERLAGNSAAFARLLSWEETGVWIAFLSGLSLLSASHFRAVFLTCAGACLLGAACLLAAPAQPSPASPGLLPVGLRGTGRTLRPLLGGVMVTMAAESAVSVLILLHLQRGYGLEPGAIALVYLPGAIVMGLLPGPLHRLVVRCGRRRVLALGSVASALFAVGLSFAPTPGALAVAWVLSAAAWAAVVPVQQAVVAEAAGAGIGRGMGLYEAAALAGGAVGAVLAGVLHQTGSWTTACLVLALPSLAGAVLLPRAVDRLGVADRPPPAPLASRARASTVVASVAPVVSRSVGRAAPQGAPRGRLTPLGWHAVAFVLGQVVLAAAGLSWLADLPEVADLGAHVLQGGRPAAEGLEGFLYGAGRVWVFVLAVDVLWTAGSLAVRTRDDGAARR